LHHFQDAVTYLSQIVNILHLTYI